MTPSVILLADAGSDIGWGHAVRQLALAEALVSRGTRVLFVTRTPETLRLDWLCPVSLVSSFEGQHWLGSTVVVDLPTPPAPGALPRVVFDDHGVCSAGTTIVDPHFGAAERRASYYGSFLGPRWAPIRKPFSGWNRDHPYWGRHGVFTYGPHPTLPKGVEARPPESFRVDRVVRLMANCSVALVPPSMVALECLTIGLPVVLYVPDPKYQPIADAMVEAGVAEIWSGAPDDYTLLRVMADDGLRRRMADAGRDHVDGRGAERLAQWLT